MSDRIDWGTCEQDNEPNVRLYPVVHHPTGVITWLCATHIKNAEDAMLTKQVPGVIADKVQAYLNKKVVDAIK